MTKKQKKVLYRIIASFGLLVVIALLPIKEGWQKGALYLVPYLVIGYDILKKAVLGVVHGEVFDENFLMAVATVGAMLLGEYQEGAAVMLFYQIGELFQSVAVGKSRRNISALVDIRPDYANLEKEDGSLEQVDPDEVAIGSVIVVKPGEKIPIDGQICEGSSVLNTSALTGESLPREVAAGDMVVSGCVNMSGLLKIRTTREFGESTVSKILDLVENSSMKKAKAENFITRFAHYYTPAVCYSALALALLPPIINLIAGNPANWADWVNRALTFLVISCPCALVISIPLSFFGGIGGASAKGILVKGSNYLELLSKTKYVVFDKTGTLTKGVFEVTKVVPDERWAAAVEKETAGTCRAKKAPGDILLEFAALAESYSDHPISKSLRNACSDVADQTGIGESGDSISRNGTVEGGSDRNKGGSVQGGLSEAGSALKIGKDRVSNVEEISGYGVKAKVTVGIPALPAGSAERQAEEKTGVVEGQTEEKTGSPKGQAEEKAGIAGTSYCEVAVGNAKLMRQMGVAFTEAEAAGTIIYVAVDGVYAGYILISDMPKEHSADAIRELKASGVRRTIMLTGDNRRVAEAVASELHVDQVHSELLPGDKVDQVEKLLAEKGKKEVLAFVGDGINDAPVLSRADVGIAMGALGSDAAIEAADIVLMDDDPRKIVLAMGISRKCLRIVYENIVFALAVKAVCLILGALGYAGMWLAIFADVGVMVLAVLNAVRCLKVDVR